MVDPTLANFRLSFAEFDSVTDDKVNFYLDDARDFISEISWGNCYGKAVLYYTAHELALSQIRQSQANVTPNGATVIPSQSGSVSSASADGLSVGFTTSSSQTQGNDNAAWLQQTPYGQAYAALKRKCLSAGRLVSCP